MLTMTDLIGVMSKVAQDLSKPSGMDDVLPRITDTAKRSIPNADLVSISVRSKDDTLRTVAPTDDLARRLDEIQYELREGPCYEAVEGRGPVIVTPDVTKDPRWPRFGPKAGEAGLRSHMAVQIHDNEQSVGLNVYSRQVGAFEETFGLAELLALHAGVAIGYAENYDQLSNALQTRTDIGKAIGIVMTAYQLSDERAFEFLVRVSQDSNVKLREIAQRIVSMTKQDLDQL